MFLLSLSFLSYSPWVILEGLGRAWNGWIRNVEWVNLQNGSPSKHFELLNDRQRLRVMDIYRIQSCELKLCVCACVYACVSANKHYRSIHVVGSFNPRFLKIYK